MTFSRGAIILSLLVTTSMLSARDRWDKTFARAVAGVAMIAGIEAGLRTLTGRDVEVMNLISDPPILACGAWMALAFSTYGRAF